MLHITIPACEQWDEVNSVFINTKEQKLILEHSLASISKWESKWRKPFLTDEVKSFEETVDYIRCMTLNEVDDPDVYDFLTNENVEEVNRYMESPMTATWFSKNDLKRSIGEQTTSETIYYQMVALNIPFECERWHFNRLLTLIRVCNEKNKPPKNMSTRERFNQNRSLNNARRKRLNTRG
jgi:hypothetical protein